MTSKDWFTLALRVIGVLKLIDAADYFVQAFDDFHLQPAATLRSRQRSLILILVRPSPHRF